MDQLIILQKVLFTQPLLFAPPTVPASPWCSKQSVPSLCCTWLNQCHFCCYPYYYYYCFLLFMPAFSSNSEDICCQASCLSMEGQRNLQRIYSKFLWLWWHSLWVSARNRITSNMEWEKLHLLNHFMFILDSTTNGNIFPGPSIKVVHITNRIEKK